MVVRSGKIQRALELGHSILDSDVLRDRKDSSDFICALVEVSIYPASDKPRINEDILKE
jgi:hypothetical protein